MRGGVILGYYYVFNLIIKFMKMERFGSQGTPEEAKEDVKKLSEQCNLAVNYFDNMTRQVMEGSIRGQTVLIERRGSGFSGFVDGESLSKEDAKKIWKKYLSVAYDQTKASKVGVDEGEQTKAVSKSVKELLD